MSIGTQTSDRAPPTVATGRLRFVSGGIGGMTRLFGAQNAFEVTPACGLKMSTPLLKFGIFWRRSDFCSRLPTSRRRTKYKTPNFASQMRVAFSNMARNTGSSSPGELEMTLNTSDVAVCCSSDCRNSLSSRVFSMAMTAWAAKFFTRSICLSVKGRTSWR